MRTVHCACLLLLVAPTLAGCQTSQSRQAELAQICANPVNRQPQNFYYSECQALYPSTSRQFQRNYRLGAPTGN